MEHRPRRWEDADFRAAVRATGRTKIVMAGLWTEVCRVVINDYFDRKQAIGDKTGTLFR
ncbi:hypothetical protein [Streptomyces sp. NPDC048172]|uniref:hypothetical protein n=1 Tax=Streptomyces sp. NPDC048172 TaxID=3365505 RepID=UPI0037143E7A